MKKIFISVATAAALFFAWGCASNDTANSDTVKQSEIYQSYTVTYNSGEKELSATASFRFGGSGGTTLLLVKPAGVTFNNIEMASTSNIFMGTFYESEKQTELSPRFSFVYTDCDEKVYTNNGLIKPAEITDFPQEAMMSEGFYVSWAEPLVNGESMYLYAEDAQGNAANVFSNATGATQMGFPPEMLKSLKPGLINIYLSRETSGALSEATHLGGNLRIKYVSKKQALTLKAGGEVQAAE